MQATTLTQKGQITIPSPIRKKLGIKPGARLIFESKDKEVTIRLVTDISELRGSLKTTKKYDEEKISEAVGKMLARRHHAKIKNT